MIQTALPAGVCVRVPMYLCGWAWSPFHIAVMVLLDAIKDGYNEEQ